MTEHYKTVYLSGTGEITEKKSRFLSTVTGVESEEEAFAFVENMKKKYWDATHNCWAFIICPGQPVMRCSDDGEPQGTAGRPMLDVLLGQELCNLCVVVTRYFGGTLLGTGGLVRAYGKAVQEALKNSFLIEKQLGRRLRLDCDYSAVGKIQYQAAQSEILILDTSYSDTVKMELVVPEGQTETAVSLLTRVTGAKAQIQPEDQVWFAAAGKEILLFEHE